MKKTHNRKQRLIALSFVVGSVLMLIKFLAFWVTRSNAILTDALESIVNVVAAGFAWYSIRLASQPRDINHPYGHGKIEFFSAGFEGGLIIIAGILIIYQSISHLIHPAALQQLPTGIVLISVTVVINAILGFWLQNEGKKADSLTLVADGKHLVTDSLSSLVLVIGVAVIYLTGIRILDSLLSLAFAGYILFSGFGLVRQSVAGLMDEANTETLQRVLEILRTHRSAAWIDIHNLRVQRYGADLHIDCHLTLPYYWDLNKVHEEVSTLSDLVTNHFQGSVEFFIHNDPCLPPDMCRTCHVENCPVRQHPYTQPIEWTTQTLTRNQKHFEQKKTNTVL